MELMEMAENMVSLARKSRVDACAVRLQKVDQRKVVYRDGQWEEIQGSTTLQAVLRLFVDGRYAVHRTSDIRAEALPDFVKKAAELTRQVMPDPHRKLPDAVLYAPAKLPDVDAYDPRIPNLTLDERKKKAVLAHDACRAVLQEKGISTAASFSDACAWMCLVHSDGFSAESRETSSALSVTAFVMDPAGRRPSDWDFGAACHLEDLDAPENIGKKAALRALASIGARQAPTGSYEILVENRAVLQLLNGLLQPLFGPEIFNRRSWAADMAGMPVGAAILSLHDDPLVPRGLGSRAFDSEGLASCRRPLVDGGVLRNFYIDTYYGSKMGRPVTTGSLSNIVLAPGESSFDALLSRMKRGLWINRFIGGNVNSTTGDFSMGVGGFFVENGQVAFPIIEMNLAFNHRRLWHLLQAVGADPWLSSSVRSPSLLFAPLLVAGA